MQFKRYLLQIIFIIQKNFALLKLSRVIGYLILLAVLLFLNLLYIILLKDDPNRQNVYDNSSTNTKEYCSSSSGDEAFYTPFKNLHLCPGFSRDVPHEDRASTVTTTETPDHIGTTTILLYCPVNTYIEIMLGGLKNSVFDQIIGFNSTRDMERYYLDHQGKNRRFCGFVFDKKLRGTVSLPDNITVSIRMRFDTHLKDIREKVPFDFIDYNVRSRYPQVGYEDNIFLALQHAITLLIVAHKRDNKFLNDLDRKTVNSLNLPTILVKQFPRAPALVGNSPKYIFVPYVPMATAFFIMLYFALESASNTVEEKNNQLKETMLIMGLTKWMYWFAWYIFWLILSCLILFIVVSILHTLVIDRCSNYLLVFLLFLLGISAGITFGFMMGTFFTKPAQASAYVILILLGFLIWIFFDWFRTVVILKSFCFIYAFYIAILSIKRHELAKKAIKWDNLWTRMAYEEYTHTIGFGMLMIFIDMIIYFLLALYIDAVKPGEYGIAKPWYFIFTADFWCPKRKPDQSAQEVETGSAPNKSFEKDPSDLPVGIEAVNLKKVYKGQVAVNDLSLKFYENQIAVLLGHNGAGKTTTMAMLTGMTNPTSGTAIVNGYDIRTQTNSARMSIGYCPQSNIVFNRLSVQRNLRFFMALKGMKYKLIKNEVKKYLEILNLYDKRKKKVYTLSGGMKRKLSIAIALCADSKIVLLDEPTSGIDPGSRRDVWDLLLSEKADRTIIVSTHFMDEADVLGDRVAILSDGVVQCCGSSFFLKKQFGAGYYLVIEKSPRCQTPQVTQLLRGHIPNVQLKSDLNSELIYFLPEDRIASFAALLNDLERQTNNLGIVSFGLTQTTLYDVFIKVGVSQKEEKQKTGRATSKTSQTTDIVWNQKHTGCGFILSQQLAFLYKKWLYTKRAWFVPFMQVLFTILAAVLAYMDHDTKAEVYAVPLTFQKFHGLEVLIQQNRQSKNLSNLINIYKSLVDADTKIVQDIDNTVLETGRKDIDAARMKYVYGAKFEENESGAVIITTYYDKDPYHAQPISLGLTLNVLYKSALQCDQCGISYVNHPFPVVDTGISHQIYWNFKVIRIAILIVTFMCIVSAYFVFAIVRERGTTSKHLQIVSGVNINLYWVFTVVPDILWCLFLMVVFIFTLACLQWSGNEIIPEIDVFVVIWLYYICATLPFTYAVSFLFKDATNAFITLVLVNFSGMGIFAAAISVGIYHPTTYLVLKLLFSILPPVSMGFGIYESLVFYYSTIKHYCPQGNELSTCPQIKDFFKSRIYRLNYMTVEDEFYASGWPFLKSHRVHGGPSGGAFDIYIFGLGTDILYSCMAGVILFLIILLSESCSERSCGTSSGRKIQPISYEDADVAAEKEKIRNKPEKELPFSGDIVTKDLTKKYGKKRAVNSICLSLDSYECFGLLGQNGAGKTTTFQMMAGNIRITSGNAWILTYSIKKHPDKVHKSMGYCPQSDALIDFLTPNETIKIFLLIRGISLSECAYITEMLAEQLEMTPHMKKPIKNLSGGNRKKVSAIIAILGGPKIMFLDEPTTGLDPGSRRHVWDILTNARDDGACVVLSSHLMEECEALCTRVTIMVEGNMKCLGSLQHVKNKYSQGFMITVKVKIPTRGSIFNLNTDDVQQYMSQVFRNISLVDKRENYLTFHLKDKRVPWSYIFASMEAAKKRPDIQDYSVSQCSLEEVFLTLTRN